MNRTVKRSFAVLAGAVGLAAGSAFAVDPVRIGSARTVADGTRFDLRFAAAHEGVARDIYALYGAADHKDDTNGWDHVELLATIPNTTESTSVTVSPTLTTETPCLRFLIVPRSAYSSLSYSQTDLAAQWDGLENAGRGLHACSTNYWTDLSGNGWDVKGNYPDYWTPNAYAFTRSAACAFSTQTSGFLGSLGTNWTVEVFVRPAKGNDVNHSGICGGHNGAKNGFIMAQWDSSAYWVGNEVSIGRQVLNTELTSKNLHHLAFSMDATTLKARVFLDGATLSEPAFSAGQSALGYPWFRIGNAYDGSAARTFQGDIHAVRVYKRVLSEDELKQHGEIDAVRFSAGGGLSNVFSPSGIKPSMSVARANRDGSGKVTSFTLNLYGAFRTDDEIYAAYGASDGGLATGLWERVELVGIAPAGETQVTVPAPADFGDELACIRFFRPAETGDGFSSADYVRNGLQAFWDGRDNIGVDDHDATSLEWVDLSGHGWTLTASKGAGWTDNAYNFDRTGGRPCFANGKGLMGSLGKSWTFEAYTKPMSGFYSNYSGLAGKHGAAGVGFVFFQYVNGTYGVGPTSFTATGVPASAIKVDTSHQLVMTADDETLTYRTFVDGEEVVTGTFPANASALSTTDFIIGNAYNGGNDRNYHGDVYSFRVYNRALTEEELAHNRIVDQIRAGDVPSQLATELFRLSVEVNLEIASDSDVAGPVTPDYGSYPDIVSQLPLDCAATHFYTNNATIYECYGHILSEAGGATVTNDARLLTFDADHSGSWALSWRWRPVAYAVSGSTYGASGKTRVVDVNADPDYGLFHAVGSTATIRAESDTDQQVFDHWEGDVPAALAGQAEIELTMDAVKTVTAVFRPTYWLYDAASGRISDGQSSIPVSADGNRLTTYYIHNQVIVASRGIDFRLPIRDAEGNPYTLVSIGDSTFVRLTFDRIFLPDTIEVIDYQAFYQCGVKCIQPFLPKSVRCIQPNAFVYCGVTNDLTVLAKRPVDMPETWNGQPAGSQFSQCGGISCITFGRGVTNIPNYFINMTSASALTNVTCYGELKTVGDHAFGLVSNLRDFRLNGFPLMHAGMLSNVASRRVRFSVPKGNAQWSAYLADTNSVTPWAKLDVGAQKAYFSRFGADAEPPFGLTLETTDHMLGD